MENTIDQVEVFKSTLVNKSKDELIQILMTLDPSVTTDSLKTSWGEVVSRYALIQRIVRALNLSEVKKEYKYYVWTEERGEGGKPHRHATSMSLAEAIEIADKEQKNTTANVYVTEHTGKTIYGITLSKQPRTAPLGSS